MNHRDVPNQSAGRRKRPNRWAAKWRIAVPQDQRRNHWIDPVHDPMNNRAECSENQGHPGERPQPTWRPWWSGRDRWDHAARSSPETFRPPSASLV